MMVDAALRVRAGNGNKPAGGGTVGSTERTKEKRGNFTRALWHFPVEYMAFTKI